MAKILATIRHRASLEIKGPEEIIQRILVDEKLRDKDLVREKILVDT